MSGSETTGDAVELVADALQIGRLGETFGGGGGGGGSRDLGWCHGSGRCDSGRDDRVSRGAAAAAAAHLHLSHLKHLGHLKRRCRRAVHTRRRRRRGHDLFALNEIARFAHVQLRQERKVTITKQ